MYSYAYSEISAQIQNFEKPWFNGMTFNIQNIPRAL